VISAAKLSNRALVTGALAWVVGFMTGWSTMLIVGCVPIAVGIGAALLALWRREPLVTVLAHDTAPDEYQGPVEVPHNEAVAALGDRGEVRPPR
jgi:hypothetical protein